MGIGTSLGAFFEDDFDHQAGKEYIPPPPKGDEGMVKRPPSTQDKNEVGPDEEQLPRPGKVIRVNDYTTRLDKAGEEGYKLWKEQYAPNDSGMDYDLPGAYKAGVVPDDNGHMPDTFKKPNHPTFSNESQYAKYAPEKAGHWDGDTYIPPMYVPAFKWPKVGMPAEMMPDVGPVDEDSFSKGTKVGNRLFGLGGEERYKTWPERLLNTVNDSADTVHKVMTGQTPMWAMDPKTGDYHTSLEGMESAWELMPLSIGGARPVNIHLKPEGAEAIESLRQSHSDFFQNAPQDAVSRLRRQPSTIGEDSNSTGMGNLERRIVDDTATDADINAYHRITGPRNSFPEQDARMARRGESPEQFANRDRHNFEQEPYEPNYPIGRTFEGARPMHELRAEVDSAIGPRDPFQQEPWYDDYVGANHPEPNHYTGTEADLVSYSQEGSNTYNSRRIAQVKQEFSEAKDVEKKGNISLIKDTENESYSSNSHNFKFLSDEGVPGELHIRLKDSGKEIYVAWIGTLGSAGPGDVGKTEMKNLFKLLAEKYPKAEVVTGFRVSGARQNTGSGSANASMRIPGRKQTTEDDFFGNRPMLTRGK